MVAWSHPGRFYVGYVGCCWVGWCWISRWWVVLNGVGLCCVGCGVVGLCGVRLGGVGWCWVVLDGVVLGVVCWVRSC